MLVEQLQHAEARIGRAGRPIHHRDARELRRIADRSEEHTSELQSPMDLVWRLLLEKKLDGGLDRKSTRLNSSHRCFSYAVCCLKKDDVAWRQPDRHVHFRPLSCTIDRSPTV